MTLARTLSAANADLVAVAEGHPFLRGIADGTLPRSSFAGYVAQDAFFVEAFARAYAFGVVHSRDRAGLEAFADLLGGVREELRMHDSYAGEWGVDLRSVRPASATLAYTDFLLATASRGSLGVTCAAMTPCMRLYAHLGQSLSGRSAGTYAQWVETYADPAFDVLAQTLEGLLDHYGEDGPELRGAYRRAMTLEIEFFDAAVQAG